MIQQIKNVLIFMSWTVTSFLCHHFAKTYLKTEGPDITGVLIVSTSQLILCFTCLTIAAISSQDGHVTRLIAVAGHVVATFATNYSFSLIHASSAMAFKMMEPISSVLIQWLILKLHISYAVVISLPLIVIGAILFTGSPFASCDVTSGFTFALVSNVALAVRNISMKHLFDKNETLNLRKGPSVMALLVVSLPAMLFIVNTDDAHVIKMIYTLLLTSLCHVTYTYISTAFVLQTVSVITHAVLNISKRVSVVLLLSVIGTRAVSLNNLLGILIAAVGLAVYVIGKKKSIADPKELKGPKNVKFYLILCLVGCVSVVCVRTVFHFPQAMFVKAGSKIIMDRVHFRRELMTENDIHEMHTSLQAGTVEEDTFPKQDNSSLPSESNFKNTFENSTNKAGYPSESNSLIVSQTTMGGVIDATQNYHFQFFSKLIGRYSHVILVDIAEHENKGDAAIGIGELALIRRLKKKILFQCSTERCKESSLRRVRSEALSVGRENVVILSHGGGNIASYERHDNIRKLVFTVFYDFKSIVFPQSIWIKDAISIKKAADLYAKFPNATLILRDHRSFQRAKEHFPNNIRLLAPDMAFQIGHVSRSADPIYDIVWIQRIDAESQKVKANVSELNTHGLSVKIEDWFYWKPTSHRVTDTLEKVNHISETGFAFLKRGRVVITDRLHGHIMSTLLYIPHVLMDTSDGKVAAYHNTWTKGLAGKSVMTAKTPQEALDKAKILIDKFKDTLPKIRNLHV